MLRRVDPILYAFAVVLLLCAVKYYRPAQGYREALGAWLYTPLCEVPAGREFSIEYYGLIYTGNTSNLIDQRVLCAGAWEKHILHFLGQTADALKEHNPREADKLVFVDVGANTGLHSLFMSQHAAKVHAFDPYPPIVDKLRHNVDRNQLKHVLIHPVGLGDKAARLPFAEPPESNQGVGSFVTDAGLGRQGADLVLDVVVGDEYFATHGIDRADIVKVDVEGFEKPVLLGLRRTLAAHRPVLVFELAVRAGVDSRFKSREDLEAALPDDYRLYYFAQWNGYTGEFDLRDLNIDFDVPIGQWDIIAAPAELTELVPRRADASW